jgi:cysteine-rich repeat protein
VTRLVRLAPACILLSCVNGSAPPSQESKDHICGMSEHYTKQPEDCFKTPTADEAATPRAYPDGAPWTAWHGLCLVDGSDRLIAGNGVCELQESLTFRSDCEPTCGDSTLSADEATTCIHDWLADRRGCEGGANICAGPADCGNAKCEYDAEHQEDACTCPEDCSTADQFRAIRNTDGTCAAPPDDPSPAAVCPCGNGTCEDHETYHSCPEDCDDPGTTTSTTEDSTTNSTTDTTDDTATDTSPPPCNKDLVCDPEESVEGCPEDCSECGDGMVSGGEACDNGNSNQTYWPQPPPNGACSEACDEQFTSCGDGDINGPEICDNGPQNQTYWSSSPPDGACSEACDEQFSFCGDGTIDAIAGETCDDMNTDQFDGCSAACSIECIVFVTNKSYSGNLGGLAGADAICTTAAADAKLYGKYKAWLSDTGMSAGARLVDCGGIPTLRSGSPVAQSWMQFAGPNHELAISVDEYNSPPEMAVKEKAWTGTKADASSEVLNCKDWNSAKAADLGSVGSHTSSTLTWTADGFDTCDFAFHLYCVQQPE